MTRFAGPAPVGREEREFAAHDALDLLDWKRRVFDLYERVRAEPDAEAAWRLWRDTREHLYRTHPQSPLPPERRAAYRDAFFPYDPAYRVVAEVVDARPRPSPVPASHGGTFAFTRIGVARFTLLGHELELELDWNDGYGGGILVAVADATSGGATYGGGRYVLDTVKGADLGSPDGRLVLDFNFAYNPSCAFDPRWSCPLAPPANRLPLALPVGERAPA
ncbi:MAG TPA: DUF1684 domain-containing protein [Gaiellaceae bacterium]|nr:DUF1684 domain-containing protein [Gaiellaceae bacterium]